MIRHLQYNNPLISSDWTIRYIKDLLAHIRLGVGVSVEVPELCEMQQFVNMAYSLNTSIRIFGSPQFGSRFTTNFKPYLAYPMR
jgi:hypothetical protein